MFWRWLLLLLIALNIGVAAWLVFGRTEYVPPPATDAGVPELELLSARPATSSNVASGAIKASGRCLRIGPFATQSSMHQAFAALDPKVPEIQFHQRDVTRSTGWWVYLPAFASVDKALSAARKLSAEGVRDYYVVTAGDNRNTVSLGLFHSQANARRRYARIKKLGFAPSLSQRKETLPEYWVDIALPAKPGFAWRDLVKAPHVKAKAVACF